MTALDGGTGETFASNEVSCVITTGSVGKCTLSWTTAPPPAASYLVYVGTTAGGESVHFPAASTSFTLKCSAAGACTGDSTGTTGTPPAANTAFLVYLYSGGIHFADGSNQITAAGDSAFMANGADWISVPGGGKYGISDDGHVFAPDGLLTVLGTLDVNDFGTIQSPISSSFQLYSNKKASTDLLWDTSKPSWFVDIGSGAGDNFSINRAIATASPPTYSKLVEVLSGGTTGGLAVTLKASAKEGLAIQGPTGLFIGGERAAEAAFVRIRGAGGTEPVLSIQRNSATDEFEARLLNNSAEFDFSWSGTHMDFRNFTYTYFEMSDTAPANSTNLGVLENGTTTLHAVTLDANDSCGAGFRCLRVPNTP